MPHFYRYRVEDNFEPQSRGVTPAAMSPIPVRRQERGEAAAHVTLLGCQADIAIPEEGAQQNKMQLNQLFKHLEDTLMNMKEENKELRKAFRFRINKKIFWLTAHYNVFSIESSFV